MLKGGPKRVHVLLASVILASTCAAPARAELSGGKLSLHLIGRYTPGARAVVASGPPVLKILDLGPEMRRAMREYKRLWPQGKTVLRVYTRRSYPRETDPTEAARDSWQTVLQPAVMSLPEEERRLIDYLEGPNECEHYPVWESAKTAGWHARFWQALAPLIAKGGFLPCAGSIPVGNPPGPPDEIEAKMLAFVPGLLAANAVGGAWSYHAYSLKYGTDEAEETWTSLRYRMLHDMVARAHPELSRMPLIITEAGVDYRGDREKDGWQARGDRAKFESWLTWFDTRLREDDYVLGATLFQCGDVRGWPSFETEPINGWLAGYLRSQVRVRPADPTRP